MRIDRRRFLLGAVATLALSACRAVEAEPAPIVGRRAPAFTAPMLGGGSLSLEQLAGKPLVLNFFATWCVPCRVELPALQAAGDRHGDDLSILLVDLQEDPDDVAFFLHELDVSLPAIVDRYGEILKTYRVRALPSTFFVDRAGVIQAIHLGAADERLIETHLAKIV